jgi:hypothetical protein
MDKIVVSKVLRLKDVNESRYSLNINLYIDMWNECLTRIDNREIIIT